MQIGEWSQLHDFVEAATRVLLSSLGLPIVYVGTVPHQSSGWTGRLSVIGLGGECLRGCLLLNIPDALLRDTHPAGGESEEELADWLAEMGNLILGQIKRDLLAYQVTIELSTPVTLSATDFRFVRFASTPVVHQFTVNGVPLHVVFESVCKGGARLAAVAGGVSARAGDVVLFEI